MDNLIKIVIAAFSGGAVWELLKLIYPDLKKYFSDRLAAKEILNKYLDPLLKTSDELFGKLSSLANEDFLSVNQEKGTDEEIIINKIYLFYLFSCFWARLSIIKNESNYISLARTKKGRHLIQFMNSFEARRNRILDRSLQRIIGDALVRNEGQEQKIMSLSDFADQYLEEKSNLKKWIGSLDLSLKNTINKEFRQRFLIFGILLQSFIDYFDKHHSVVRDREVYLNKMSRRTKFNLKYGLFDIYLPFIEKPEKYYHK